MRGNQQDVVERQRLPGGTHLIFSYAQKRIIPRVGRSGKPRPRDHEMRQDACARASVRAAARLTRDPDWITLPMS